MRLHYMLIALFFLFSCDDTDENIQLPDKAWQYLGLENHIITEIKVHEDMLLAATHNGMFKKSLEFTDTLWQSAGLEGKEVTDFTLLNVNEFIASTKVSSSADNTLFKTTEEGLTWEPLESNFGGGQGAQTCQALEKSPAHEDVLYARGTSNVAKSTDGGITWESTYQDWSNIGYQADLIMVDENNPDIVWAGGETSIFSPYLIKSVDKGETWLPQHIPSQGDNAVYSMAIHPDNSDRVLVGMEAQIISTTDGGENWEVNITPSESSYVHDIQNSRIHNERVYATGTDGGNDLGDIILFISDNFGDSWETVKHEGNAGVQYGALDLALVDVGNTELVFVGTNRGVFVYRPDQN